MMIDPTLLPLLALSAAILLAVLAGWLLNKLRGRR